jgi:sugar phosphate isomerase/epimerase
MQGPRLGVVSNSWAAQLPESSLSQQCVLAVEAGFGYVELRQGALGGCESPRPDGPPWPEPDALAGLRDFFPELGFNLALEAPFLTHPLSPGTPYLAHCIEAALALDPETPLLRFVDLSPADHLLSEAELEPLAEGVAAVAERLAKRGIGLALENSKQPVAVLLRLLDLAAARLPKGTPAPRLCWDPANQVLQQLAPEDPLATARALSAERLFEYHFKQVAGGAVLPGMGPGDLDWSALTGALAAAGFAGPALFELPPGEDAWERLEAGRDYVRGLIEGCQG